MPGHGQPSLNGALQIFYIFRSLRNGSRNSKYHASLETNYRFSCNALRQWEYGQRVNIYCLCFHLFLRVFDIKYSSHIFTLIKILEHWKMYFQRFHCPIGHRISVIISFLGNMNRSVTSKTQQNFMRSFHGYPITDFVKQKEQWTTAIWLRYKNKNAIPHKQ